MDDKRVYMFDTAIEDNDLRKDLEMKAQATGREAVFGTPPSDARRFDSPDELQQALLAELERRPGVNRKQHRKRLRDMRSKRNRK